jgi:DNA-directed RNA polymerase specialized sigma24 family protein
VLELAGRRLVRAALQRRSQHERRILSLLFYERLTPSEVAAAMGLPPGEVARTLDRVLAELSVAWGRLREDGAALRRHPPKGRRP